jgi:RimJ/RimL family protein N-acetyltransferase
MTAYVDEVHQVADLGIMIGERKAWGGAYGPESWTAVCGYLFDSRGLRKITAGTIETNVAMVELMNKTGMVEDGRRKAECLWEGREVDVVHAALFRDSKGGH